jgi:hypothetical protein
MSRLILLLCCVLLSPLANACEVEIRNSTNVGLSIPTDKDTAVSVEPGQTGRFVVSSPLWVDFGAMAHEFETGPARKALCPGGANAPVRIEARSDGALWLDTPGTQPDGFPLRPVGIHDLTGSPSNNSFKPKPLRGSAQLRRWRMSASGR